MARRGTDGNMAHVHCMPDTKGYKHIHSEYIIFIDYSLQHRRYYEAAYHQVTSTLPAMFSLYSSVIFLLKQWRIISKHILPFARLQGSAAKWLKTAFFWVITQRLVVISYHYSRSNYREERSPNILSSLAGIIPTELRPLSLPFLLVYCCHNPQHCL